MKSFLRTWLFAYSLLALLAPAQAQQFNDCTLEPDAGSMQAELSNNVNGHMTWSSCTSILKVLVFEWPQQQGVSTTPDATLKQAAGLVSEWEEVTNIKISSFDSLTKALEKRARELTPYVFGEDIPVTDVGITGWDGVSLNLISSANRAQLTVQYWANP